jgi:hypothetical protein
MFSLFLTVNVTAQEESPMTSFMDAKWGISAQEFSDNFRYKDLLKRDDNFFYLTDFELGDIVIKKIKFKFEGRVGQDLKFKKKNFDKIYFTEAFMLIKPEQFEKLFEIFKVKYGEPQKFDNFDVRDHTGEKYEQKVAIWDDKETGRMVIMEKQASKLVDGLIIFIPKESEKKVEKRDIIKEAAEKI